MSLSTLTAVKAHLGIASGDTSEDTALTAWLSAACSLIRSYVGRDLGGLIQSNTVAAASVVTAPGHGLTSGDIITIAASNSTPVIDGEQTVTVLTADTFTVPVTVTVAGSAGYWTRKYTEYYCGQGDPMLLLRQTPVVSVSSVYLDSAAYFGTASGAFAASTLLASGEGYAADLRRGVLVKIGGVWPNVNQRAAGLLASGVSEGVGNIKVTYSAGYAPIPGDLQLAANQIVAEIKSGSKQGGGLQSESSDYYSYSRMNATDAAKFLSGSASILARYKRWTI